MKLEKKIAELKAKNTEFRINQADQYQRMFKPYTDPDDIYEEFKQLLSQEIQTAVQKERTELNEERKKFVSILLETQKQPIDSIANYVQTKLNNLVDSIESTKDTKDVV